MEREDEIVRDLLILLQPTRLAIVRALKDAGRPLYIREIAEKIKEDWRITAYHLAALADAGFVEGEFRSIEQPSLSGNPRSVGKAGKFYKLTEKVDKLLSQVNKLRI